MTSSRPPKRFDWNNLRIRVLSATALICAVVAVVFAPSNLPPWSWAFLTMISVGVAFLAIEWGAMAAPKAPSRVAIVMTVAILAPIFLTYLHLFRQAWIAIAVLAVAAGLIAKALQTRARDVAYGVVYLGPPCVALTWLHVMPNPISWTILVFAVTWCADIAAFAVGNALKGPKLSPRYSPNKTWSGFFGGLCGAMIAAVVTAEARIIFSTAILSLPAAAVIGLIGGLATMVGDLWESMLKRNYGVKDSGDLIPGHGGLLDRVDGLMFAVVSIAVARLAYEAGWGH
ncbi:MAG TPA: phosphatidate cytidylyltransferase [Caulobacteraceae bacterium]|jgi:phosphatidate cytidylyltransferase